MVTKEILNDGKIVLSVLTAEGWVRHVFENDEHLAKYETKCYDLGVKHLEGDDGN